MTTEDQDAEVGRLVRERRELRAHHEAIVAGLQNVGKLLSAIGKTLYVRPPGELKYPTSTLEIETDGSVRVSDEYHATTVLKGQFPSASELRDLLQQQKAVAIRLTDLENQLKAFGI